VIVITAESNCVGSAVDVATIVAVLAPTRAGVKVTTVPELTFVVADSVPALAERFTVVAALPVAVTTGVTVRVWLSEMVVADGFRLTPVTWLAAFTVTFAEALTLPPAPVQVMVAVCDPVAFGVTDTVPLVVTEPDSSPAPVQLVALVVATVRVVDCPNVMLDGLALMVAVGRGLPPPPPPLPRFPPPHATGPPAKQSTADSTTEIDFKNESTMLRIKAPSGNSFGSIKAGFLSCQMDRVEPDPFLPLIMPDLSAFVNMPEKMVNRR
jgi:hypothetical protein